jgi:hypothetical protein
MFGPRRTYSRELFIDKEALIMKFKNSPKFIYSDNGFWGSTFKQSRKDELFVSQYESDIFHISENAGFGGILEVIGKVKIDKIDKDKSLLKVKLQMGMFPVNLPQIEILVLLISGLILLPLTSAFLLLFSMISFLLSIKWLVNYLKVRFFLRNLSNAIGIENNWEKI